jgi:hypothetical protein
MTTNDTATSAPGWVGAAFEAIDELVFDDRFSCFTPDTDMYFGAEHVHGRAAIEKFFVRIDEPLDIVHRVVETWTVSVTTIVRGEADMAKKTSPDEVVTAPFIHIYEMADTDVPTIRTLHVCAGPLATDKVL